MEPYVEYTRSCAYHEAAHAVAAAVQGMPLTEKGVHLDRWGSGITYYRFRKPDGSVNVGREGEREKTIIVAFAGWIAQRKSTLVPAVVLTVTSTTSMLC